MAARFSGMCSMRRLRPTSTNALSSSAPQRTRSRPPLAWRHERRTINPHPEAGLSSSLQAGLRALGPEVDGALVLLGDQPLVTPATIERVIAAWRSTRPPIVAARYSDDAAPNPVLLDREVRCSRWPWRRPDGPDQLPKFLELVTEVAVTGDNPDVDTPADLARLEASARLDDGGGVR